MRLFGRSPRRTGAALAACLAATAAGGVLLGVSSPAQARYATGGSGQYTGEIDWFEWSTTEGEQIPNTGVTRSNTRTVGGSTLETTCSIGAITRVGGGVPTVTAVAPGNWGGSGFDDLYNIGGAGGANQLLTGLAVSSQIAAFDFSCGVTLDGTPVPIQGLVMADAEQSAGGSGEYVQATIPSGTWRVIDRFRTPASCANETQAVVDGTGAQLRLANTGTCPVGPMAVAFMDGATSAQVEVRGGGTSILALGVVLSADYSDAPATYGDAGALLAPVFTGGAVAAGASTPVSGDDFTLATLEESALRLGATATSEGGPSNLDDDTDDGVSITTTGPVTAGGSYSLPVACAGTGVVAGWLDWNADGAFGAGEASSTAACAAGSATVGWTVPADAVTSVDGDETYLRLAIGPDAAAVASPTGLSVAGEVEDHALEVAMPAGVITDDAIAINAGTPSVTFNPLANDTATAGATLDPTSVRLIDGNGDPVTSLVVPGQGTWTVDPTTGALTFTPEPGFVGTATPVTYEVTDSNGTTGRGTIRIVVANPCPEDGLQVLEPPVSNVPLGQLGTVNVDGNGTASGTVHSTVEPLVGGLLNPLTVPLLNLDAEELVHQVNCQVVVPVENLVDAITIPIVQQVKVVVKNVLKALRLW